MSWGRGKLTAGLAGVEASCLLSGASTFQRCGSCDRRQHGEGGGQASSGHVTCLVTCLVYKSASPAGARQVGVVTGKVGCAIILKIVREKRKY